MFTVGFDGWAQHNTGLFKGSPYVCFKKMYFTDLLSFAVCRPDIRHCPDIPDIGLFHQ